MGHASSKPPSVEKSPRSARCHVESRNPIDKSVSLRAEGHRQAATSKKQKKLVNWTYMNKRTALQNQCIHSAARTVRDVVHACRTSKRTANGLVEGVAKSQCGLTCSTTVHQNPTCGMLLSRLATTCRAIISVAGRGWLFLNPSTTSVQIWLWKRLDQGLHTQTSCNRLI